LNLNKIIKQYKLKINPLIFPKGKTQSYSTIERKKIYLLLIFLSITWRKNSFNEGKK